MNYKEQRKKIKKGLGGLEGIITKIFKERPSLIELNKLESVVELVHVIAPWYSWSSIDRIARKIRSQGRFDTKTNIEARSNYETAYNEYFNH